MDKLKEFIEIIKEIDPRLHALVLILLGLASCVIHKDQAGLLIVGGGLGVYQNKQAQ